MFVPIWPVITPERSPNPNFLVRIFSGGVGVFHVKGWGAKNSGMPFETQGNQIFWRDIPGFCRDIAVPEKFARKKGLCSILVPYMKHLADVSIFLVFFCSGAGGNGCGCASRWPGVGFIFQRGVELTALIVDQLRKLLTALLHAPKSSLENLLWVDKSGPRSFTATSHGELVQQERHWVQDESFLDEHEDIFWIYDEDQCYWIRQPFQGRFLKKGGKPKGESKKGASKGGKGSASRRFFRPFRKGSGKGKKFGKTDSSSASKANIAKKKKKKNKNSRLSWLRRSRLAPQAKKKHS